jgi:hypothetical protein
MLVRAATTLDLHLEGARFKPRQSTTLLGLRNFRGLPCCVQAKKKKKKKKTPWRFTHSKINQRV